MRRKLIIAGAVVTALAVASVAYAASLNHYTAKLSFTSSKAGTAKKPVSLGYTETLSASNVDSSKAAAPLVDIKTTIYGLVSNIKDFKTCSFNTINTGPKFNAACPKGSQVGSGSVNSDIGGPSLEKSQTFSCKPGLVVYNAGHGKEWYFFTASGTQCGPLHTGQTQPYPGTVKQQGKNLVIDVPLPPFVSTMVAHQPNLYGSLINEVIKVNPASTKFHGKTVYAQASVACKGGKRPYSVAFTAVPSAGAKSQTSTVTGSAKC